MPISLQWRVVLNFEQGLFPVRLKSGRLVIVMEQTAMRLFTPDIQAFRPAKSDEPIMPKMVDLNISQESVTSAEDPAQLGFDQNQIADI
jgi:hypothetical protein